MCLIMAHYLNCRL
uniref:Uncharacterized protein n=1 Tax=Rhizophora mucronata TaxID=61149 RepID=A0A2P2NDR7_RHIMU